MMLMTQEGRPTVRANQGLKQTLGGFATVTDGLDYAARGDTGFNFYSQRGKLDCVLRYRELREMAVVTGRQLLKLGLRRGDRIGVVAETTPEFMTVFFGCQYAGLVPCPLPYSMNIGGHDAYVTRLAGMLTGAGARAIVASEELIGYASEAAGHASCDIVISHEDLAALPDHGVDLTPFMPGEAAYIQYSSGSTSQPKGVLITQKAVASNAFGILNHGLCLTPQDRASSWLPLYHDMGLVGFCLAPLLGQVSVDYLPTSGFARRPLSWLRIMSQNQCTIAYSPTFGYELAARRVNGSAGEFDLTAWRVAGIGGDMVRAEVLDEFAAAFAPAGFDERAFLASYGMAESTLAVTFAPLKRGFSEDVIDRAAYKRARRAVEVEGGGAAASSRRFVKCGVPLPGHKIEVRCDNNKRLAEREIGHIFIKGPSLMSGYFLDDAATEAVIGADGWLKTGDMGYLLDGEIVITGRCKDLILHNGRNIWPQDIEWAAENIHGLRSGDVAAFAIEDADADEQVVVLAQCRVYKAEERENLRREIASTVYRQAGIDCTVVLVPPRSLPFTSSGKLSRAGAKLRYLSGEIAEISRKLVADKLPLPQVGMMQNAAD
jgi:fatty-acyl-CoA synthase